MNEKKKLRGEKIVFLIMILAVVIVYGGSIGVYYVKEAIINYKTDKIFEEHMAVASDSALKYIREKYGFEAENPEADTDWDMDFREGIKSKILRKEDTEDIFIILKMTGGGRDFRAIVYGYPDSITVVDNYQYDEITAALTDKIAGELPGGNVLKMQLYDKKYPTLFYSFFDIYYTGDNIDEIIDRCNGEVEMIFTGADFSDSETVKMLDGSYIDYRLASFAGSEKMEEFTESRNKCRGFKVDECYKEYSEYITDYRQKKSGEITYEIT
ncbi:MAG: hypothetical protein K2K57_11245 [Oscillospiraceae bacterium]|nr:hypothetical protein [Oscillospiraceae bacterium]